MPAPIAAAAAGTATRTAATAGAGRAAAAKAPRAAGGGKAGSRAAAGGRGASAGSLTDLAVGYGAAKSSIGRIKGSVAPVARTPYTRALVAEFVVCIAILALSPLGKPKDEMRPKDWMKRGSAMCAAFILLGLLASIGQKSGRTAVAIGGLITLVLVVDQRGLWAVVTGRLKTTGQPADASGDHAGDGATGRIEPAPPVDRIEPAPPVDRIIRGWSFEDLAAGLDQLRRVN